MTNLELFMISAVSLREIIGYSTVWDFHHADHLDNLVNKKGTNLNKFVDDMKKKGLTGGFTMFVDRIGRSGHSASRIVIFKGITNDTELGSDYYSNRVGEFFI